MLREGKTECRTQCVLAQATGSFGELLHFLEAQEITGACHIRASTSEAGTVSTAVLSESSGLLSGALLVLLTCLPGTQTKGNF